MNMDAKEKLNILKDKAISSIKTCVDNRINDLVEDNPKLKIASKYIKRGVKNYITEEQHKFERMIDNVALFICDENGNIDTEMLFDDLMTMFREMDEANFNIKSIKCSIGKGVIRLELPKDALITKLFFGDIGAIRITEADFMELKDLFIEN